MSQEKNQEMSYIVTLSCSAKLAGLLCSNWWATIVRLAVPVFSLAEVHTSHVHRRIAIQIVHLHAISCSKHVAFPHDQRVCLKPGACPKCPNEYQPLNRLLQEHPGQTLWNLPFT